MKGRHIHRFVLIVLVLLLASLACSGASLAGATQTPEPSTTPSLLPTRTSRPTFTPRPTSTPNAAATARYEAFDALLEEFEEKGYITTTSGFVQELEPFEDTFAQIGYFRPVPMMPGMGDFVFSSHFMWETAHATPDISGCGILFGLQENGDYYAVFLDKKRILFQMIRGSFAYNVGKTRGVGTFDYGNPAEADFALAVKGQSAYVWVDGVTSEYTLSQDQTTQGWFGYALISGTNKDYGTRCEMTDIILWTPE